MRVALKCLADRFSAYYMADWLRDGMEGAGFFVVTAWGNPTSDESHWVTEPVRAWARGFKAHYLGDVGVAAAKWGAVAEMPDKLQEARDKGAEAVQTMRARK